LNNKFAILSIALFCILTTQAFPQTITGVIADKDTKEPIEYANIGVIGKSVGTVSNEQGP